MELSRGEGADHSVIHAFEPVYANGNAKAIIGVSFKSREMMNYSFNMMRTMLLITAGIFAIMLILVIHHIRKIVIRPLAEEQRIIEEYEQDKDSLTASRALNDINTDNEIERLADSFSSMVTELDRYMEEYRLVTAEKERIGAELSVATHIQADMLPRKFPAFPDRNEFDLYATMTPAKEVGGDFYDFFLVDDDHIALVMADVSGKGVPAALFMVIAKTLIKNHAMLGGTPAEILSFVNDQLCEGNESELFVTVWLAIIEISTGKGIAANAGHEHPALKHKDGQWELVVYKHSPAVATMEGIPFREHEFELTAGDRIFVYTDGVPEATDKNDELYGPDRMIAALNACGSDDPKDYLAAVKKDIDTFVGDAPQFDDITMLGFNYDPPK
jgi:sigma-B regulation protein RsbU (phosphoserine phosphatase)